MAALKRRVFYLHYNRNAFNQGDPNVWSVRTSKGCFHAPYVVVYRTLETVVKPSGPNPRAFLKGTGHVRQLKSGTVVIR